MKLFWMVVVFLACLLPVARAQQAADDQYLVIHGLMEQGDALAGQGALAAAGTAYADALAQLRNFQKLFPSWHPDIVSFRLDDLAQKAAVFKSRPVPTNAPPAKVETPAPVTAENIRGLQSLVDSLQAQLQSVVAENATLQARLREALAAQPATADPGELAAAREQIRSLMKENDLLKASHAAPKKTVAANTNELAQALQQKADYAQKFSTAQARAETLAAENAALRKNLSAATNAESAALHRLRGENEKLRDQTTALLAAAASAPDAKKISADLKSARSQIADLQAAATDAQKKFRDLTQTRDALQAKLDAANQKKSDPASAAELTALRDEVKVLRARLAVDEAATVPYTAGELALLQPPAPPATVPAAAKPVPRMPAGTAALAASAAQHFANHEFDQAEADYRKILERSPDNGVALANLATIELQAGKLAAAEQHIQAALAQSPDDAYDLATFGYLKFRQEKYDEALASLGRAAAIEPNNPEIQNYLGVTLGHKGLRQQAENALRRAIALNPNYAPAHNNLAVIYLSQTPPVPALARWHYQKALEGGQPRNPEVEKMLADKGAPVAP